MRSLSGRLALPLIALLVAGPPAASAQAPAAAVEEAPLGEAAPVMTFAPGGVSLDDAIAATLRLAPDVQQGRAEVQRRMGVAQQWRGLFDTTLFISAQYTHRTQELSESQKDTERRKREDLRAVLNARDEHLSEVQFIRDLIDRIRNAPGGGGPVDELATVSPAAAATIRVLDRLIASAPPGQQQQFITIRENFLLDSLAQFEDEIDSALSDFQRVEQGLINLGEAPIDEVFIDASGTLTVSKLFRSGIAVSPFFDATFNGTNFKGKPRAPEFGGKGIADVLQFRAGLNATLPLLRGRGARSVAAAERAAAAEVAAGQYLLSHQAAASVLRTATAYWNARAAREAAEIAERSVEFQSTLTQLTEQIIKAGDLPQVELARAQAAEARARAQLEEARRRYHEARVALADAMGVAVTTDPNTLPDAADAFPDPPPAASADALIERAVENRADLYAASHSVEASSTLADAARDDLRPRLDLQVGTWFTALGEGSGPEALDRWVGPSAGVGFQFEKPLGNNTAQGMLVQRQAELDQTRIAQRDLDRRIRLGVIETTGTIEQARARVVQAEAAVEHFQTIVEAELARFRAGDVTLLDTVITQQQQVEAQLALVLARQELAQRLAELQYQTGALVALPAPAARE
jgi:outer membrane protein TolC